MCDVNTFMSMKKLYSEAVNLVNMRVKNKVTVFIQCLQTSFNLQCAATQTLHFKTFNTFKMAL